MNIEKIFNDTFNAKYIFTEHAFKRLQERFFYSEITQLRLLIQASLRYFPLNKWKNDEQVALVDPRFNFSILCSYYPEENIMKIITFIRGKNPEGYKKL